MTEPLFQIDREACREAEPSLGTEWLQTDGRGGYAASTVWTCPTRRYHGWLVAPLPGGVERHLFLAGCDEHVTAAGVDGAFPMATVRYADGFADGHDTLCGFELAPWPRWQHELDGVRIRRELLMPRGRHAVLWRYELSGVERATLRLRPLLAFRPADALTFRNDVLDPRTDRRGAAGRGYRWRCYDSLPGLALRVGGAVDSFAEDPTWYEGVELAADLARGYDGHEDRFSPGVLTVELRAGAPVVLAAWLSTAGDDAIEDPAASWQAESERRRAALPAAPTPRARAALAADDFLFRAPAAPGAPGRLGVLAGFPWFREWGRDVFIALPGLTLARGQVDRCAEVLTGALEFLRNGLLPNVYGAGAADSHYGSADASLWFARAVFLFDRAVAGDAARRGLLLESLLPALDEIAQCYLAGTGLGIGADPELGLAAGGPELNATWMDARTSAGPVTPREGCAVELGALWYALLAHLERLYRETGDRPRKRAWLERAQLAGDTFVRRFWLGERAYLADRWHGGVPDATVRPNMVIAAALELSPLTTAQRRGVVERARSELWTPRGLRTLSPADPAYVGRYEGGPEQRDKAYHQGTAWPWLCGFFTEAALRAGAVPATELRSWWDDLSAELDRAGLNHVSEVFDGDAPQRPGGTFAQAWNTGELLRALALLDDWEAAR